MTKYYKVTLPTGQTFTRTTASRAYSHMVVAVHDVAQDRKRAEAGVRASDARNRPYHTWVAQRTAGVPATYADGKGYANEFTYNQGEIDHAIELIAESVDDKVRAELENFDRIIATTRYASADRTQTYSDAGWCGRADLAEKLASTVGHYRATPWIRTTVEITKQEYAALKKANK